MVFESITLNCWTTHLTVEHTVSLLWITFISVCFVGSQNLFGEILPRTRGLHWDWDPASLVGTGGFKFAAGGSRRSKKKKLAASQPHVCGHCVSHSCWKEKCLVFPSWDHCCRLLTWTTLPIRPLGLIKSRNFLFEKWSADSFCTNQNLIISPSDI